MAALGKRKRSSDRFVNSSSQTRISRAETSSNTQDELRAPGDGGGRGFVEGSIVRITMQNFLSYNYSEVVPGPNLNMIVGPNGTGKSSIVCAICLGLAGKTAVLGRGDKVGLYVKRGCTKGFVEIELYRTQGNLVINREIHVENNQSVWMVNGRHTSQKAVEEEVRALRIQVGNLCQFLPQEKVGEFAKMSKIELLEATEKSVGPPEMYKFHCELKTFRTKERELENVCKEKASFLERAKQRNERNRQDVERFYEKKRHMDMIKMLENKRPWVEYETVRCELEAVKAEREETKKKLKTLKETQAPILRKIQAVDGQLQPIESQMKEKAAAIKQATLECKRKQDELDSRNREIEDVQQALRLAQTEEAERQKRISNTRRMIDDLQAELDSVATQEDVQPQINAVSVELRQLQDERTRGQGELSDLFREKDRLTGERTRVVEKLRSLEDVMKRKEEVLRRKFPDTYNALLWLRQNRQRFTGNVHEPMMLVINVRDARHAKYIESHVALNDLRAFVFQRQQDMETFMTEVRDHQKLRVNAVIAPHESCAGRAPSRPLQTLRHFGFFSYLRELFDAPEEVMSYLCHQYRVHDVPVGTQETKAMIETVIRESQLKILFTAEEKYTVRKSSYSQKTISSNTALRPPHYLSLMVDAEEKHQLQERQRSAEQRLQSVDRQLKALQERHAQLDRRDNELRAQKKELSERKGKKRQLEQKISTKQDSLRQMEGCGMDLQRKEQETGARIRAVNSQKVAIMTDFTQHIKLRARLQLEVVYLALDTVQLSAEKNKLESESRDGGARLRQLEQENTALCERKSRLQETCRQLLRRAKEICNLDPGESSVPQRLQEAFGQLPDTLDEIDALLHEERSRAECFTGLSATVVEEYTRGTQEIEQLTGELEEKRSSLETYRQHISQAKENWLNPLKQLVEQINEKFSDFFRSMQCAGEVDLHSESEEEYDKYGIRIRVKFRSSTQLHELTPHHQSGGERSVSTMLYLMALQELNLCPFRVVDEINQGMDPVNERRVFDIVVRTACKGTTSQYFFITPKVLQNLRYADEMTILCVHNGLQMLPPNKWNEKAFIRRAQRRAPPADR
ncbi:structural maintenance of chromosomes protein 5 [Megalops cyprinoides]|uniref:structural maintenance of chromosomes protein 5 n=1 Tax=Megalops cyprinoides TaxID=118141 RepID=UPI001864C93B|nr:structural maintenance of chromosomes protein 5 [Megalops cyprinoides]